MPTGKKTFIILPYFTERKKYFFLNPLPNKNNYTNKYLCSRTSSFYQTEILIFYSNLNIGVSFVTLVLYWVKEIPAFCSISITLPWWLSSYQKSW